MIPGVVTPAGTVVWDDVLLAGKFLYFTKPLSDKEQMSSGVLVGPFVKGPVCLTFYYYLNAGGHIRVFLRQADSTSENPYEFITERYGKASSQNRWRILRKHIPARPNPYQVTQARDTFELLM